MARCQSLSRLLFLLCLASIARLGQPFTSPYLPERIIIGVSESFAPDRLTHEVTRLFVSHGSRSKSVYASKHGYDMVFISHGTVSAVHERRAVLWDARGQPAGVESQQELPHGRVSAGNRTHELEPAVLGAETAWHPWAEQYAASSTVLEIRLGCVDGKCASTGSSRLRVLQQTLSVHARR